MCSQGDPTLSREKTAGNSRGLPGAAIWAEYSRWKFIRCTRQRREGLVTKGT